MKPFRQLIKRAHQWGGTIRPVVLSILAGTGCATTDMVLIESENQDSRVNAVIIHFTTADFEESLEILTQSSSRPVSSHYLIPEPEDPSYSKEGLELHQLVSEGQRAWHAGRSYWGGKTHLNNSSIGIELVNQSRCHQREEPRQMEEQEEPDTICFYPDFAESQLEMLISLLNGILERHPDIKPTDIIGHADIAPQRKVDPGPRFPWQRLHRLGIGAWYDDTTVAKYWELFAAGLPTILRLQDALHTYGYEIDLTGEYDTQTHNVVRAFQMHFIPWRVSGSVDVESAAVLFALIEKYHAPDLSRLLVESPEPADQSLRNN